jgi:hypothetical protein
MAGDGDGAHQGRGRGAGGRDRRELSTPPRFPTVPFLRLTSKGSFSFLFLLFLSFVRVGG